jgi:hypothetical protein
LRRRAREGENSQIRIGVLTFGHDPDEAAHDS